ncbi:MAG: type VI secretion system accessory protein TagJ [Blastocatellia bacterium]
MLDRAEEQRPALQGKVNGKDFLDFRDYDDVAGPVLELIVGGQYVWLPFEQIKSLEIPRPGRLRDLIWPEVRIDTIEGSIGEVFAFALYEGSSSHGDDRVKLGRMTDWVKLGEDLYRGSGLRLLLIDEYDSPIFEANRVEFCNDNFTTGPLPM